MKIIAFGDVHAGKHSAFAKMDENYGDTRWGAICKSLEWLKWLIVAEGPDHVIFLGDVVHDRQESNHQVLKTIKDFLHWIPDCGYMLHCLVGNHDIQIEVNAGEDYPYSAVDLVAPHDEASEFSTIYSGPGLLRGNKVSNILMVPYYKDMNTWDPQNAPSWTLMQSQLAFVHLPFAEAGFGEFSADSLHSKVVVGGHYHTPQEIITPQGNKLYLVGALLPQNFADEGDGPFGAAIITLDDDTGEVLDIEQAKNPHAVPFRKAVWEEGQTKPDISGAAYWQLDVKGSDDFCTKASQEVKTGEVEVKVRATREAHWERGEELVPHKNDLVDRLLCKWAQQNGVSIDVGREIYKNSNTGE